MLLRPDATFMDQVTKRAERVFPQGSDWLRFESALPGKEVFANSVLDPAIGLAGDLATQTFAAADWQNWVSTAKVSLFEIGTRIGIPPLEGTSLASGVNSRARSGRRSSFRPRQMMADAGSSRLSPSSAEFFGDSSLAA